MMPDLHEEEGGYWTSVGQKYQGKNPCLNGCEYECANCCPCNSENITLEKRFNAEEAKNFSREQWDGACDHQTLHMDESMLKLVSELSEEDKEDMFGLLPREFHWDSDGERLTVRWLGTDHRPAPPPQYSEAEIDEMLADLKPGTAAYTAAYMVASGQMTGDEADRFKEYLKNRNS